MIDDGVLVLSRDITVPARQRTQLLIVNPACKRSRYFETSAQGTCFARVTFVFYMDPEEQFSTSMRKK